MKSTRSKLPIVALVGRPNVGKSRLFNRFVKERRALVENTPGVTRDRNYGTAKWDDRHFTVIDTGGFEPDSTDVLLEQMRVQAQLAVEEADVILFIVDARAGVLPADFQIADILRKSNKRVILVVNKIDQPKHLELTYEFYELAFDEIFPVSAEHGFEFGALADAISEDFPIYEEAPDMRFFDDEPIAHLLDEDAEAGVEDDNLDVQDDDADFDGAAGHVFETQEDAELYELPQTVRDPNELYDRIKTETISIAVLGKPNTGKSTLINHLLGYKRLLTADIAGTTRDTIDSELVGHDGQRYILIDTAGIRRKSAISQRLEKFSIIKALDAVERADVVLILVEAPVGVTDQDLKIAALAAERGCAIAVLLNKWDVIEEKGDHTATRHIKMARERFSFIEHAPFFTISALTGTRTHRILDIAKKLYIGASVRIPTGELNRVFKRILEQHNPPSVGSRNLRFYYAQQVAIRPPTFVIQCNAPKLIPTDYKRFIMNQIRAYYGFDGSPIRILFRKPAGRRELSKKETR